MLEREGITVVTRAALKAADKAHLEEEFLARVFPVLSPLAIDPAHPFPFIPNEGLALALQMRRARRRPPLQALLPIPSQIDRFVRLPATDGEARFLPLEELLLLNRRRAVPGLRAAGSCAFRVLRDSDLEVEEEAEDLVREFETALKRRRRGEVVRLQISAGAPEDLRGDHRTSSMSRKTRSWT
jgi:polyphosphate kinase